MEYKVIRLSQISAQEYQAALSVICEKRRMYLQNLNNTEKVKASVCGEWLVKCILAEKFGISHTEVQILRTEKGKPYLSDSTLHISISHSGDFVAAAVDVAPIGIDIEVIKDRDLKICRRLCSESDMKLMEGSASPIITFYKIWTAKEAYFKKIGSGITALKSISYNQIRPLHILQNDLIITIVN